MKNKVFLISAISLFVLVNTSYFWEGKLGIYTIPVFGFLALVFILLFITSIYQVVQLIKERFRNRNRLKSVLIVLILLVLIYIKPAGIFDFESLEGNDLLIAGREGSANCFTTFKLKENNRFVQKGFCFGISEMRGKFVVKEDTIFFSNVTMDRNTDGYFEFAVIKKSKLQIKEISEQIMLYRNREDGDPYFLFISKNKLHN